MVGSGWQRSNLAKPCQKADPGFVSPYSMSSIQEDKAEVFARLMEDPTALAEMASKDAVIRAKVERMKQLVATSQSKNG